MKKFSENSCKERKTEGKFYGYLSTQKRHETQELLKNLLVYGYGGMYYTN